MQEPHENKNTDERKSEEPTIEEILDVINRLEEDPEISAALGEAEHTTQYGAQYDENGKRTYTTSPEDIAASAEGRRIENIINDDAITTIADNTHDTLASAITDHLWTARTSHSKRLFVKSIKKEFVFYVIKEYIDALDNIDVTYTRKQLITDVILMIKGGNAAAGKMLIDLLGFNAVAETYKITNINYKDVPVIESDYDTDAALAECRSRIITAED